ncbi:hypothetical protein ABIB85_004819 [Bradyrhizobium sp. JR1.5]
MWWSIVVVLIGSMPLAANMARKRERSHKVWFCMASLVGPLAPLIEPLQRLAAASFGLEMATLELGRVLICGRPARCKRFLKKIGT